MSIHRMTDATQNYHPTNEDGVNLELASYIGVAERGAISFWPSLSSPKEPFADQDR
jgi:hypothetical protein